MNKEERAVYMSLSKDPNERGRLWKEHPMYKESKVFKSMSEYYDKVFMQYVDKLDKDAFRTYASRKTTKV